MPVNVKVILCFAVFLICFTGLASKLPMSLAVVNSLGHKGIRKYFVDPFRGFPPSKVDGQKIAASRGRGYQYKALRKQLVFNYAGLLDFFIFYYFFFLPTTLDDRTPQRGSKIWNASRICVSSLRRNITNIAKSSKFYCNECSSTYSCALKCMIWTFRL